MYEHRPDTASVVRVSADGRRAQDRSVRVERPVETPEYFADDFATNAALEAENFEYGMGDTGLLPEEQGAEGDSISVKVKAKRYQNSDLPFQTWVGHRDKYLDETLRLEGRGNFDVYSSCGRCKAANPLYRCEHQSCYGPEMFCKECIVARHEVLPTHWIQEWNGGFFTRVGLSTLGLVVQLGHTPGSACGAMRRGRYKFTLIDVTGIHNVAVQFCECDARIAHRQQLMRVCWWPATARDPSTCATMNVIRLFENMNCLGKISAFHFLRSLELLTNADGLHPLPHCMTEMYKRAGRGHTNSGIGGTAQGELALLCRACPQPEKNLARGWESINWAEMPEDLSYKYFLYLAQDCNFRLINRNVSSEARDPIVDDGLGYFCNREEYKKYLAQHVDEEEISTCSGFQAMFLANSKKVKGLRSSGVGGVTCARHNMWRANGIGDLQRGERQSNMDFIFFSSLLNAIILYLILSYDIACQYSKKFWKRMEGLPAWMQLDPASVFVWFKVPNFHILGHKWPCHSPFSFQWMWGAGMTDGEDVEQNWDFTNGAAGSTKMMGPGGRHAFLEGLFAFHNWMRTVSYRKVFGRRMTRDLKEGRQHREAFTAFTALLEGEKPELVGKWRVWVLDWESTQHTDGVGSPFEMSRPVHTMKDIHLRLGKEELTRTGAGVQVERQHTSSTFISMGLELEQSQYELEFVKRKTALLKRISRFHKLQRIYMPELVRFLTPQQRTLFEDKTRSPEAVKLFMPSELAVAVRAQACEKGLEAIEEEMREGELQETLEELRQALRLRTMTNRFRRRNMTGQRALTRGQGVLRQITIRVHKAKLRYCYARNALARLRGHGPWEKTYKVLEEGDVRGINERAAAEEELAERETMRELGAIVEGGIAAAEGVTAGEGRHKTSWIWWTTKTDGAEEELVEALRVEWCRGYARMRRWNEDVVLIEEEMRRTIEFGAWMAGQWETCATARTEGVTPALQEGLCAYALEHVQRETDTSSLLSKRWGGLREKARAYLAECAGEARPQGAAPDIVVDLDLDDEDPADEEGDVPGEEVFDDEEDAGGADDDEIED
ncbi:hypothetical protein C8F04DRAFT_1212103 [Mycena alexandri]|uniref:CxC2-like cysteine cluster KDZ transposase-associated domain-containing protein n=1 Tax=Mycena alexandri TaxID=1745969 RepID=A0AAD6SKU1_9AGAR|nr:hypothetical protein C8F04DRAFT_1212103 [Mycena alexandri]